MAKQANLAGKNKRFWLKNFGLIIWLGGYEDRFWEGK